MLKIFNQKRITRTLYVLLLCALAIPFSCNIDDYLRDIKKKGGSGKKDPPTCIDKSKINPRVLCPQVIDPVCGCDGIEYTNSCEAEKKGVIKYTKGRCKPNGGKDDCIDKSKIDPNKFCTKEYRPVCGCDGIEYPNACHAEKNGVIRYTPGKCKPNGGKDDCIDKSKIDPNKFCTKEYQPVCGCNGVEYPNACHAEKNGIIRYTPGKCKENNNNDDCYDKSKYDPNKFCPKVYEPVCGCDGNDYSNPCEAEKNGIVKYIKGKCKR